MGISQRAHIIAIPREELKEHIWVGAQAWLEAGRFDFNEDYFLRYWQKVYDQNLGTVYSDDQSTCYVGVTANKNLFTGEDLLTVQFVYVQPRYRYTASLYRVLTEMFKLNSPAVWMFTTANENLLRVLRRWGFEKDEFIVKGIV